jgi:glycosyltransferase involved in cell wall biosynthesis
MVQVAVTFMRSGTEAIMEALARDAVLRGWEVTTILPTDAALDGMQRDLEGSGIPVRRVGSPFSREGTRFGAFSKMRACLSELDPDLVHYHVPWAPAGFELIAPCYFTKIPVIVRTEHNPIVGPLSRSQQLNLRLSDPLMSAIVFVSDGNRRRHAVNGRTETGVERVIPNGISMLEASPAPGQRDQVREELGISPDVIACVMLGQIVERKGPFDFVRLANRLSGQNKLRFFMIGDGPDLLGARALAEELGLADRIQFLGRRSDARRLLGGFDIYVQPSHYEGMSLAMLEALAAGLPMVTTNVDGVSDVVGSEKERVYQVPVGDIEGLASGVLALAADVNRRRVMGAWGRERVSSHFTHSNVMNGYAETYEALMASAKRGSTLSRAVSRFTGP